MHKRYFYETVNQNPVAMVAGQNVDVVASLTAAFFDSFAYHGYDSHSAFLEAVTFRDEVPEDSDLN